MKRSDEGPHINLTAGRRKKKGAAKKKTTTRRRAPPPRYRQRQSSNVVNNILSCNVILQRSKGNTRQTYRYTR